MVTNRRRALVVCTAPSLILGLVLGALTAIAVPLLGVLVAVVVTVVVTIWLWRRASGVVLRAVGARRSDEIERPRLHNLVEGLCATMGLPHPAIYIVDDPTPNALAVGRDPRSAALVVTSSLDERLSLVELEGVLAHELVHIKRRDTVIAGAAVSVLAPLAAVSGSGAGMVRALVGQGREFVADQRAVSVVRYPPGLGSALETMTVASSAASPWPPGPSRVAAITRWLWIDPMVGYREDGLSHGNLDDTAVRAAALAEL